jgi:hypothetical protein
MRQRATLARNSQLWKKECSTSDCFTPPGLLAPGDEPSKVLVGFDETESRVES